MPSRIGRLVAAAATGLVLLVTLGLTAFAWQRTVQAEARDLQEDFDFLVRDTEARIGARMEAYEQVLRGAAALFGASRLVNRDEFRSYVASLHLEDHYPGIQGVGFALVVPPDELPRHVAAVRAEGFPTYQLRPAGPRDAYTSIVYLEPFAGRNLRAFGYDMLTEPIRRAAMEKARDEGQAALSGKVTLVQETSEAVQFGVLMYQPVYRPGPVPLTVAERRERLVGWAYTPFRMGDLMVGILGERGHEVSTRLFDGAEAAPAALLFDSAAGEHPAAPGRLRGLRTLEVVDRTWAMAAESRPAFDERRSSRWPAAVLAGGVLISLLLSLLVWALASARDRAVALAEELNRRLLENNAALAEGESRLAAVIAGTDDGTVDIDVPSGQVTRSPRYWEIAGWLPGSLPPESEPFLALLHPDDAGRVRQAAARILAGRDAALEQEYRLRGQDGSYRWVRARLRAVLRDAAGRPLRISGTVSDAEERHRQQERALEEARLHGLSSRMNEADLVLDLEGVVVEANERALALYGRTREELLGIHVSAIRAEVTRPVDAAHFVEAAAAGLRFQTWHLRRDGARFPVEVSSRAFEVGGRRYVHSLVRDLTEQRRQEAELRLLAGISQNMQEAVFTTDPQFRITRATGAFQALLGWAEEELLGQTPQGLFRAEYADGVLEAHRDRLRAGQPSRIHARLRRKDGRPIDVEVFAAPLHGGPEADAGYFSILRDVTAERESERALRESEGRLAAVIEGTNDGFWDWEIASGHVVFSPRWASMLGYEVAELAPDVSTWSRLVHPEDLGPVMVAVQALLSGATPRYETEHRVLHKDGRWVWILDRGKVVERDAAGKAVRAAGTHTDITTRKHAEEALEASRARATQAERLAATATLARGMAHEVNNPLSSVIGNLGFVQDQLTPAALAATGQGSGDLAATLPEVLQALKDATESASRIGTIVADLRSFALGDLPSAPGSDALAGAVRDAMRISAQDLAACRSVALQVPEACTLALPRPDLVQLLAHLLINAGQATGPGPNDVRVEAVADGPAHVRLLVTDTGAGMSEAVRARVFEPFFTTKGVGKGRGLGLSVCLGIVQAALGEIDVQSAPGHGTTVTVRLPAARPGHDVPAASSPGPEATA